MQAARPDPTAALAALNTAAAPRSANPATTAAGGFAALMQQAQAAPAPAKAHPGTPAPTRDPARSAAPEPQRSTDNTRAETRADTPTDTNAAQRRTARPKTPAKADGPTDTKATPRPQQAEGSADTAATDAVSPATQDARAKPDEVDGSNSSNPSATAPAVNPAPATSPQQLAALLGRPIVHNLPAAVSPASEAEDSADASAPLLRQAQGLTAEPGAVAAAGAFATPASPVGTHPTPEAVDKTKAKLADKASQAGDDPLVAALATGAAALLKPATDTTPAPALALAAATANTGAKALASDASNPRGETNPNSLSASPIGAFMSAANTAASAWSSPVSATTATLTPYPGHPDFAEALGSQVSVWVGQGVQEAQLQLNPKDMGPVQVWIALEHNAAQVRFAAEHSATREALQAALPELAQALAREGLQLDSASVQARAQGGSDMGSPGGFAQARQQGDAPADGRRGFLPAPALSASPPARAIGSAGANLLDLYA